MTEYTYKRFNRDLTNSKILRALAVSFNTGTTTYFTDNYQSQKCVKEHPSYFSLITLLKAADRTADVYQQFDLDDRNVKNLAKSIFQENLWLMIDPVLAKVEDMFYLVGGRHRIHAITAVFAHLAKLVLANDHESSLQSIFDEYLNQEIRCELLIVPKMENLLALIGADNEGRTMRKPEKMHLKAQVLGAEYNQPLSAIDTAMGADLAPVAMKNVAAQNFVWRESRKFQPDTKQRMGERIAHYLLFGVKPNVKVGQTVNLDTTTLGKKFDILWDILTEIADTERILARNVAGLCDKAIAIFEERYPEMLLGLFEPKVFPTSHIETTEVVQPEEQIDAITAPLLTIIENKNESVEPILTGDSKPLEVVGIIKSTAPPIEPTKTVEPKPESIEQSLTSNAPLATPKATAKTRSCTKST